jgi:polygalacturonase
VLCVEAQVQNEIEKHLSNLPFDGPKISLSAFKDQSYNILDYGAKRVGITKNTQAIAKAIIECNSKEGGPLVIPSGMWITGPIELKSKVDLLLENGAIIVFSDAIEHS